MSTSFRLPKLHDNPDSWGPTSVPASFSAVPFSPFGRHERLGRAAELSAQGTFARGQRGYNRWREQQHSGHVNAFGAVDLEDETSFSVVEAGSNGPGMGSNVDKNGTSTAGAYVGGRGGRGRGMRGGFGGGGRSREVNNDDRNAAVGWSSARTRGGGRGGGGGGGRGGKKNFRRFWRDDRQERARDWSVDIGNDWSLLREIPFSQLAKLSSEALVAEDLRECGSLRGYNRANERIATKTAKKLVDYPNTSFYRVSASRDPVLKEIASGGKKGNVFATDAVLTQLMAAGSSKNSWDVVVTKKGGKVWLDKRDGSSFDFHTVSETCLDELPEEDEHINSAFSLSREATMIDENFSQQVLAKNGETAEFGSPNPFATSEETPAPKQYRYRVWTTSDGLEIVARFEIDAFVDVGDKRKLYSVHAVHEFDPKISGIDWRRKIDNQRSAVIAHEMKGNNCKFTKWAFHADLAGCDGLQLGFVSRLNPASNKQHMILGCQSYNADYLSKSLNASIANGWGIVRAILGAIRSEEDGKFVILKDPSKASLRIYKVPADFLKRN